MSKLQVYSLAAKVLDMLVESFRQQWMVKSALKLLHNS
jgi:hypothetical protein